MSSTMTLPVARAAVVVEVDNPDGTKTQMLFKLQPARAIVEAQSITLPGGTPVFEGYQLELEGRADGFTMYRGTLLDEPVELERPRAEVTGG